MTRNYFEHGLVGGLGMPGSHSGAAVFSNGLCQALMKQERNAILQKQQRLEEDQLFRRSHLLNLQSSYSAAGQPSDPIDSILRISKCSGGTTASAAQSREGRWLGAGEDSRNVGCGEDKVRFANYGKVEEESAQHSPVKEGVAVSSEGG